VPQAIPLIFYGLAAAGAITAATAAYLAIASALAIGLLQSRKAKRKARDALNASFQDRLITERSAVGPRQYVLGKVRVAGTLMYANTVGANRIGFDAVFAYAANVCDLAGYYIGEDYIGLTLGDKYGRKELVDATEKLVVTGPTAIVTLGSTPAAGSKFVGSWTAPGRLYPIGIEMLGGNQVKITGLPATEATISLNYKVENSSKLQLLFRSGTRDQDSPPWPSYPSPEWTTEHRLRGVCWIRQLALWDENLWPNGATNVTAILKGGRIETLSATYPFFDPRDGSNPDYTDNPALHWLWWRTLPRSEGGMGTPIDWIDLTFVSVAANICDELITVRKLDGTGYETIKRYQCNTVLVTDISAADNEEIILSAMAGRSVFTGGQYRVVAGAFRPAAFTITDDDVIGTKPTTVVTADPNAVPPNVINGTFADAAKNWIEQEPTRIANDDYIARDGHEESIPKTYGATTDARQVHYLMGIDLETGRPAFGVTLTVGGIGENIALLDTCTLNLVNRPTYVGRTFEVLSIVDNWDGTFDLTLGEIKTTTWALDPDTFTPSDPVEPPDLSYLWKIPAITGFDVKPLTPQVLPDGTAVSRVDCSWDPPPGDGVAQGGHIQIRYRAGNGADWIGVPELPGDATRTTITAALIDGAAYQFQIRAVSSIGANGPWTDAWLQITGTPLPTGKSVRLRADSLIFSVPAGGPANGVEPAVINLTIDRQGGLTAAAVWTTTPATVSLSGSDDARSLAYVSMGTAKTVQITASVTESNVVYEDSLTVSKIFDGTDGPDYTPDPTAPPTPQNLQVTPSLFHLFLEWDPPSYTQGHGHASTVIYGVKIPTGGPQPTFANAVELGGTPADVYSHPAGTGETWAFWIKFKTVDGVLSVTPAGGTNGKQGTTGKIGNVDLGPLIVEAGNLANGSITAQKVADGAIAATKFASGIEPVTVVTTVPTTKATSSIFNATDGKLYVWNGSAYVLPPAGAVTIADNSITTTKITDDAITSPKIAANAVTASEIAANAVTAGKIAANAVTAGTIAANAITAGTIAAGAVNAQAIAARAITTDKLLVGGQGAALNPDPTCADASAFLASSGSGSAQNNVLSAIAPGGIVLRVTNDRLILTGPFPIIPGKTYRLSTWARQVSGGAPFYLRLIQYDVSGAYLADGLVGVEGVAPPNTFTRYSGKTTGLAVGAVTGYIGLYANWVGIGVMDFADVRCEEAIPGELIVDGAITATKLAANSIAVGTAAIQNGAIVNAMIGSLAVDDAKISSLSGAKIVAGTIDAGKITAGTITADRLAVLNSANGMSADFSNGRVVFNNGSFMTVIGTGFGTSNQFIEWYGPARAVSACDEASAISYKRVDGQAYFGGALLAGKLQNAVQSTDLSPGNVAILGPFSSNGHQISITFSYNFSGRTAFQGNSQGLSAYNTTPKQTPSFTIVLSRSLGGGAFADMSTISGTGGHSEFAPSPSDVAPGSYNQFMSGSSTFVDPNLSTLTREYRLRITAFNGVNTSVINNTLAIQSVEQ
jgi:hypothetical protein